MIWSIRHKSKVVHWYSQSAMGYCIQVSFYESSWFKTYCTNFWSIGCSWDVWKRDTTSCVHSYVWMWTNFGNLQLLKSNLYSIGWSFLYIYISMSLLKSLQFWLSCRKWKYGKGIFLTLQVIIQFLFSFLQL